MKRTIDEILLHGLLKLNEKQITEGPRNIDFAISPMTLVIGIGNDHVATIFIHKEDLEEIMKRGE